MRKYQFRDDFTWQAATHGLKFGTNYIYTELGGYFYFGASGYTVRVFRRSARDPDQHRAAIRRASPRRARCATSSYAAGQASHEQKFHQVAFYAQDDWRVTPKLTLNLGLRWDANIGNLPDQTTNRTHRDPEAAQRPAGAGV